MDFLSVFAGFLSGFDSLLFVSLLVVDDESLALDLELLPDDRASFL